MSSHSSGTISFLDPVQQGSALSERAVDVHVVDGVEFLARWYHSPYDSDLMIWFDGAGRLARFQLNSAGQIVDWNSADGLRTGLIVELEITRVDGSNSPDRKSDKKSEVAETIQFDPNINARTAGNAQIIIEHCVCLASDVRSQILELLLDRGACAGSKSKLRVNASRTRFWGRFKGWTIQGQ